MLITFADSSCMQGLILSVSGKRMRVALKDHEDPSEFTLSDDSWLAEDGRPVTFVFPLGILESQEILTAIEEVTVENARAITVLTAQPVLRFSPDRRPATGTN